jgi:hypothetical protein
MRKPTIHMGGTDAESLAQDAKRARDALAKALDALTVAHPNARDYYPQGGDAHTEAANEHAARIAAVMAVRDEMTKLFEHAMEAVLAREERNQRR